MKTIAALLVSSLTASITLGQSLSQDNAIREQFIKNVRNPRVENLASKTTNVYVDFMVTKAGKVADVRVLDASMLPTPYIAEVNRVMGELSARTGVAAGEYVLPVVFETKGETKYIPNPAVRPEVHKYFIQIPHRRKLLNEVYVAVNE